MDISVLHVYPVVPAAASFNNVCCSFMPTPDRMFCQRHIKVTHSRSFCTLAVIYST